MPDDEPIEIKVDEEQDEPQDQEGAGEEAAEEQPQEEKDEDLAKREQIAKDLLKKGLKVSEIVKESGLSKSKIYKLRDEMGLGDKDLCKKAETTVANKIKDEITHEAEHRTMAVIQIGKALVDRWEALAHEMALDIPTLMDRAMDFMELNGPQLIKMQDELKSLKEEREAWMKLADLQQARLNRRRQWLDYYERLAIIAATTGTQVNESILQVGLDGLRLMDEEESQDAATAPEE